MKLAERHKKTLKVVGWTTVAAALGYATTYLAGVDAVYAFIFAPGINVLLKAAEVELQALTE